MKREFFAGGNTGEGFFDLFDSIVPEWEKGSKAYILKGGPGVGKNTMMREIARTAAENGYDTELFYCAGDPDSLDAVRVPEKDFVILDGTAPHVREPGIPGVTDSILNLGVYLQESELKKHRGDLEHLFLKNKKCYEQAYLFLNVAAALERRTRKTLSHPEGGAAVRTLFLQAITHKGSVDLSDGFLTDSLVMQLPESEGEEIAGEILQKFEHGRIEVIPDPLLPEAVHYIHIPEAGIVLEMIPGKRSTQVEEMIQDAVRCLQKCKKTHDEIELIYKSCMNFAGVSKETKQLLKEIS